MKNKAFRSALAAGSAIVCAASATPAAAIQVQLDLLLEVDEARAVVIADFLTPGADNYDSSSPDLVEIAEFEANTPGLLIPARLVFDSDLVSGLGGTDGERETSVFTPWRIIDPNGGEGVNNGPAGYAARLVTLDDVDVPVDDAAAPRDTIAFSFERAYSGPSADTAPDEATLFIVGESDWFENEFQPLENLQTSEFIIGGGFEARFVIRGGDAQETTLYDEEINGRIVNASVTVLGGSEDAPLLPALPQDPEAPSFEFILDDGDLPEEGPLWIDPEIAEGYDYLVEGRLFESVTAPSLEAVADGDGLYVLSACGRSGALVSGETIAFSLFCEEDAGFGVDAFSITGIDLGLALDPLDPEAFVTGVTFAGGARGAFSVTQTPRIVFVPDETASAVPLPAAGWMLLAGLGGLAALRRRG